MSDRPPADELELSDRELLRLIESHGFDRRTVMGLLGAGTVLSLGAGSAVAAQEEPRTPQIDPLYGYATPDVDEIPRNLRPDHEVELHVIPEDADAKRPPLFHFEPSGLAVDAGDIVQFTFNTPDHTITAYHPAHGFQRRVPEGVPPFSSPIVNAGGAWLYRFETDGLYDVYCGPHHVLGMAMRIVVGDLEEAPAYEDTFEGSEGPPPILPPFSKEFLEHELDEFTAFVDADSQDCEWVWLTPRELLDTSALDPENIQSDGTVSFDDVLGEIDRIDVGHDHE